MIRVFDNRQANLDTPISMVTVNCDGLKRYWYADSIEEFKLWWNADMMYFGPGGDDLVLEFNDNESSDSDKYTIYNDIVEKYKFDECNYFETSLPFPIMSFPGEEEYYEEVK